MNIQIELFDIDTKSKYFSILTIWFGFNGRSLFYYKWGNKCIVDIFFFSIINK